jgi:hypothetical protein
MTGLPLVWGATPDERQRPYPADAMVPGPVQLLTRAIDVSAPVELTWRWLCQVAVAPYSYDWIDNRGRPSPRELTPGADRLELGQTMAVVFRLVSFEDGDHWTAVTAPRGERLFGPVAMTYAATPHEVLTPPPHPPARLRGDPNSAEPDPAGSRIVCRLAVAAGGPVRRARAYALAWGDLVMMRKQLLNLKALAERDAALAAG